MITDNLGYQTPSEIKDLDIINTYDLEKQVSEVLPKGGVRLHRGRRGR